MLTRIRAQAIAVIAPFALGVCFPSVLPAQSRQALEQARNEMVEREIVAAGVKNPRVLEAMRTTPRHEFVPLAMRKYAYEDFAMPIGSGQTISPPFVVAYMTEQLDPQPTDKVLEIGTGSGYQAAVLSPLVREVYTIEIVEPLGRKAAVTLRKLRYRNVHTKIGDGYQGWPEHAPFDKIIVTCSPEHVPPALVEQLREGGRMIVPVGERYHQNLHLLKKVDGKLQAEALLPTLFVPMTGAAEDRRRVQPDPANPSIYNGDFEETVGDSDKPDGWHYQRQLTLVSDPQAPSGTHYVTFTNSQPGLASRALQGFPVDGREVRQLNVSCYARGSDIRPGVRSDQLPVLLINYFDENRAPAGEVMMRPWLGTFEWRRETAAFAVPLKAREAIIRIGLLGGIGELSLDDIRLEGVGGRQ